MGNVVRADWAQVTLGEYAALQLAQVTKAEFGAAWAKYVRAALDFDGDDAVPQEVEDFLAVQRVLAQDPDENVVIAAARRVQAALGRIRTVQLVRNL